MNLHEPAAFTSRIELEETKREKSKTMKAVKQVPSGLKPYHRAKYDDAKPREMMCGCSTRRVPPVHSNLDYRFDDDEIIYIHI